MKEYLAGLVSGAPNPTQGRNVTREYLQARILGALQRAGGMIPLAFHGGTALRFLYSHGRYSEDLDFALERESGSFDFRAYLKTIRSELSAEGYSPELKISDQKTVQSAFVRFPGLLFELGLSPQRTEVFAIKIEVDTQPPQGANLDTTVIRKYMVLQIQHHDRASLLAGKLHAILQRPFIKGRDLYDLLWYLSDTGWPPPNLTLLNNALRQTNWVGDNLTEANWRQAVRARLESAPWDQVKNDVRPFLEPGVDVDLLKLENLLRVLDRDKG
jgi:predicted nucleotidyltransferase component of viral defense system